MSSMPVREWSVIECTPAGGFRWRKSVSWSGGAIDIRQCACPAVISQRSEATPNSRFGTLPRRAMPAKTPLPRHVLGVVRLGRRAGGTPAGRWRGGRTRCGRTWRWPRTSAQPWAWSCTHVFTARRVSPPVRALVCSGHEHTRAMRGGWWYARSDDWVSEHLGGSSTG